MKKSIKKLIAVALSAVMALTGSLAGITQLITVVLADKIHHHEYIRSLKPLIA